ncbi:MAG: stage III sporulation protein AE [Clostridiales bacterium]|nr:stage III sporulation protein AE [Clostridiales bacterium]
MKNPEKRIGPVMGILLAVFLGLFPGIPINVRGEEKEERLWAEVEEDILNEMDLSEMQEMLDSLLGEESFSISEALADLLSGERGLSKEGMVRFLSSLFFTRVRQERENFLRILLLILLAAVFSGLAQAFDSGQIGEMSFYMVYLLLFILLMNSFSALSDNLEETLRWLLEFMRVLSPAYYISVAAASGASTAAAFYQGILLLLWLFQWVLLSLLLPGGNLYVLLCLVNHLSREEMLGKMAELLNTAVSWGLRALVGVMAGLQVVRGLVAPVMDSLRRSLIGKTASALPGIGNAVDAVTELVLTTAVLVRNSLGVLALFILALAGAGPLLHCGFMSLAYRLLAAIAQPVSDRRLVGCLATMGEACGILLRILLTAEVLCMLTFLVLMASFHS